MKQELYRNNVVFRILFPAIAGLILYLAMLMVFGSLDLLTDSFFSQEALFIIMLTYLNHEWSVFRLKKGRGQEIFTSGNTIRLVLHLSMVILVTLIITSVTILFYFIFIIGYFHFLTELITINVLMILFQMLIHLYYIGIIQIGHLHAISMEQEEIHNEQLELELETFENEMNPGLLMGCLETLISLIHRDIQDAEKYIQNLSDHYRYLLENRQREFVEMDLEMKSVEGLVYLLGRTGEKDLSLEYGKGQDFRGIKIIPGTLSFIVFYIVNNMIISSLSPVNIHISLDQDENVLIGCKNQPRIVPADVQTGNLNRLNRSYNHYTGFGIEVSKGEDIIEWKVPHIPEIKED
jgi:hypothetical protein